MNFAELVFKRIDGSWIKPQDYIDWANELLEGGCDAPSIWQLAACRWDVYVDPEQVERLFLSSIRELGLDLQTDWYRALCIYSCSICEEMLQGKMQPWDCMLEMLTIAEDHNEPYIHWIWLDLVEDLDQRKSSQDSVQFNGALDLECPEESIRKTAQQFVELCSISLPEKFPLIWYCEKCEAILEEGTFTETKTCTCIRCGGDSAMKNMRFFEHRDALVRKFRSSKVNMPS